MQVTVGLEIMLKVEIIDIEIIVYFCYNLPYKYAEKAGKDWVIGDLFTVILLGWRSLDSKSVSFSPTLFIFSYLLFSHLIIGSF